MFDVLIPAAEKDFSKMRYAYDSILKYITGFNEVHCITNVKVPDHLRISGVNYYLDGDVIHFDFSVFEGIIKDRTGWYRQQFIKWFQNVTSDDYLVSESDNIYIKKVRVFKNGKPVFVLGNDQYHVPYYRFTEKLFGFGREYPYSFINEIMLLKRDIINEFVASTGMTKYGFFAMIAAELNRTQEISGMSDYDLYGNYVTKYHKDMYEYEYVKFIHLSKTRPWTDDEIKDEINKRQNSGLSMIKMHTWL